MNTDNLLSIDELAMFSDLFSVGNVFDSDILELSSVDDSDKLSDLIALGSILTEVKSDVTDPDKVASGLQLAIEIYNVIINKSLI